MTDKRSLSERVNDAFNGVCLNYPKPVLRSDLGIQRETLPSLVRDIVSPLGKVTSTLFRMTRIEGEVLRDFEGVNIGDYFLAQVGRKKGNTDLYLASRCQYLGNNNVGVLLQTNDRSYAELTGLSWQEVDPKSFLPAQIDPNTNINPKNLGSPTHPVPNKPTDGLIRSTDELARQVRAEFERMTLSSQYWESRVSPGFVDFLDGDQIRSVVYTEIIGYAPKNGSITLGFPPETPVSCMGFVRPNTRKFMISMVYSGCSNNICLRTNDFNYVTRSPISWKRMQKEKVSKSKGGEND